MTITLHSYRRETCTSVHQDLFEGSGKRGESIYVVCHLGGTRATSSRRCRRCPVICGRHTNERRSRLFEKKFAQNFFQRISCHRETTELVQVGILLLAVQTVFPHRRAFLFPTRLFHIIKKLSWRMSSLFRHDFSSDIFKQRFPSPLASSGPLFFFGKTSFLLFRGVPFFVPADPASIEPVA